MVENMDAIYEELLRLKSEGVDRIFINSDTTELLSNLSRAKSSSESEHTELGDNNEPIKSHSNPSIPKTAKKKADLVVEETNTLSLKPKSISLPSSDKKSQMDWLRKQIESCATCTAEVRSDEKIVFGSGDVNADIFFCSDAPNEEEARSGTPLTGSLGDLMFKIIKAMGLKKVRKGGKTYYQPLQNKCQQCTKFRANWFLRTLLTGSNRCRHAQSYCSTR